MIMLLFKYDKIKEFNQNISKKQYIEWDNQIYTLFWKSKYLKINYLVYEVFNIAYFIVISFLFCEYL